MNLLRTAARPKPGTIRRVSLVTLSAAVVTLSVIGLLPGAGPSGSSSSVAGAATAPKPVVEPGTFKGLGFDACTAPPSATMKAWLASPYRAVGIYFGGANRGCTQANLTAAWVTEQHAAGWHLLPIYVGPQASCTTSTKQLRIDNANAAAQGRAIADDAVNQARAVALAAGSTLIYDMESYHAETDPACRAGVLAFMNAWTARLHDGGYISGFYSSASSGVADVVGAYNTPGYVQPDFIDFARWDTKVTTVDPSIAADYWPGRRRIKQYLGGHPETYGGVTINVDNDYVDVAPLPSAGIGDYTRNGWSDVLARTTNNGGLYALSGNGTSVDVKGGRRLSGGWGKMDAIVRIGDLNRDGFPDVVAHQKKADYLWFYAGTASGGLKAPRKLSGGWKKMTELTAIGDFNRDGYPDLVARQIKNKKLYLYPGRAGNRMATPVLLAKGDWTLTSELAGVGDFNRDGYPDLAARVTKTGKLYLYPGKRGGLAARKLIGSGFAALRDVVGVGDFDRDGFPDLAAVQRSNGGLWLYPGAGNSLKARVPLGGGFAGRTPLL
jgi:hypothetical protein